MPDVSAFEDVHIAQIVTAAQAQLYAAPSSTVPAGPSRRRTRRMSVALS